MKSAKNPDTNSLANIRSLFDGELSKLALSLEQVGPPEKGKGRGWIAKKDLKVSEVLLREAGVSFKSKSGGPPNTIIDAVSHLLFNLNLSLGTFTRVLKKVLCLYPANIKGCRENPENWVCEREREAYKRASEDICTSLSKEKAGRLYLHCMEEVSKISSKTVVLVLMCVFRQNLMGIYDDPEKVKIGDFLPMLGGFFNHSCNPNTAYVIKGDILEVRAIRYIAKGEEVCISYVALNDYKKQRSIKLMRNFLMADDAVEDNRLDKSGPEWKRNENDEEEEDRSNVRRTLDKIFADVQNMYLSERKGVAGGSGSTNTAMGVATLPTPSFEGSLKLAKQFLQQARLHCSPNHPKIMIILDFVVDVLIGNNKHQEALEYLAELLAIAETIYPRYWFRKAAIYGRAALCHFHVKEVESARKALERRKRVLRATRGTSAWDDGTDAGKLEGKLEDVVSNLDEKGAS